MRRLTVDSLIMKSWRLRPLVLAGALGMTSAAWLTARPPESTALAEMIRTGKLVAQLNHVPSHSHRYRATLQPELTEGGQTVNWRVLIETAAGKTPARPTLAMRSWMPEAPSVVGDHPTAFYLGDGAFRVDQLRFDRPGWWSVSVTISDAGVTDSLAFNLIVP